jgi:ParB family chromosome partitioning protein
MTGPIHRRRLHSARDVLHSSESNEWYTPAQYIRPVRRLLGTIDLDPASCAEANAVVQATHFYTVEDDGLVQPWYGRVWLNPPYGKTGNKSNQEIWSQRLMTEYEAGNVQEAVLLVNAATDTIWFQKVWRYPICFVAGRIRFWRVEGVADSPTHGSALVYLGGKIERFGELFSTFGVVARAWKSSTPDR